MIVNKTPKQEQPDLRQQPAHLRGEIIAIEDGLIRVRLANGQVGCLKRSDAAQLGIGDHGAFRVERYAENDEAVLSLVIPQASTAPETFEHDVDRLQTALTNHQPPTLAHEQPIAMVDEQSIQRWLKRVDKSLDKLRRNRSKRLDEEFYSGS